MCENNQKITYFGPEGVIGRLVSIPIGLQSQWFSILLARLAKLQQSTYFEKYFFFKSVFLKSTFGEKQFVFG